MIQNGGNGDSVINQAEAKSSLKKVLGWSEDELIRRLGTFVSYNENGEMVIYGFGQQEVLATDSHQSSAYSRAYSQARLQAVNNIKNFVAEDLVAKEVNNKIEKGRSYVDKTNDYFSSQNWELAIKSKATTLNIATEQIRQWEAIHPKSNTIVAGYVVAWTYSHSQQANKLKKQLNNKNILNSNIKRKPTTKGKITITGDDEDL